jgi:hypothetical protein
MQIWTTDGHDASIVPIRIQKTGASCHSQDDRPIRAPAAPHFPADRRFQWRDK